MDTDIITQAINQLDDNAPVEAVADALNKLNFIREAERELRAKLTERMISHIRRNGALRIGTKKYVVGQKKDTKCRDREATMRALMGACANDAVFVAGEFISANGFRPGACKDALSPEVWAQCFEVTTKDELREGKPAVDLIEIDERFVKSGRSQGEPTQE